MHDLAAGVPCLDAIPDQYLARRPPGRSLPPLLPAGKAGDPAGKLHQIVPGQQVMTPARIVVVHARVTNSPSLRLPALLQNQDTYGELTNMLMASDFVNSSAFLLEI